MAAAKRWGERESLVLDTVYAQEEQWLAGEDDGGMFPGTRSVETALQGRLGEREVSAAVDLLVREGYLTGIEIRSMQSRISDWGQLRLTGDGRVQVGAWPAESDPAQALVDALTRVQEQQTDPEVREAVERMKDDAQGLPGHAAKDLVSMLIKILFS